MKRLAHRILDAVRAAKNGLTVHELIAVVYGEDGGPLAADRKIRNTIMTINAHLKKSRIAADKLGRGARYRIVRDGGHHADRTDHRTVRRSVHRSRDHGGAATRKEE
jgi:hypothetical protein